MLYVIPPVLDTPPTNGGTLNPDTVAVLPTTILKVVLVIDNVGVPLFIVMVILIGTGEL
jgi:hypothetical protein